MTFEGDATYRWLLVPQTRSRTSPKPTVAYRGLGPAPFHAQLMHQERLVQEGGIKGGRGPRAGGGKSLHSPEATRHEAAGAYGRAQRLAAAGRQSYHGVVLFGFRNLDIEV